MLGHFEHERFFEKILGQILADFLKRILEDLLTDFWKIF